VRDTQRPVTPDERNFQVAVKWDINMGTVVTITIALATVGIWVNTQITSLGERVANSENFRQMRTAQTDKNFVDLGIIVKSTQESVLKQGAEVTNLTYRMGQNETRLTEADKRMDRIADSILGSVGSLKDDVARLSTKFEVMNQKIDSLDVPRTKVR